ncbi:RING-HC_RNF170 domain-containing protein [Hoplias malabaricus]|uniref:RING-HC_RNF170 domain-containing protein n=1 Tax=Hoplias malabaricus TaxID=27720 RepID=UPI0034626BAD
MDTCHKSYHRTPLISGSRVQGQAQGQQTKREELSQSCISEGSRDLHCPVCLQSSAFPVETNCGHVFCGQCLISYWKHGSWLDAISCPLCRQKVNVMCHLFGESRLDRKQREVLDNIRDYNKRYSGAPRRVSDYLCDAPVFMLLLLRTLGNMGGLVCLFLLRVAVCGFGAAATLVSPIEAVSGPFNGAVGILDDLVVVFLLLISIFNIHQQMASERTTRTNTVTQGILTDTL